MAELILNSGVKEGYALVPNTREGLTYPFEIGEWDHIRIGFVFDLAPNNDIQENNANYLTINDTFVYNGEPSYPFVGFKNNYNGFPTHTEEIDDYFLGIGPESTSGTYTSVGSSNNWHWHSGLGLGKYEYNKNLDFESIPLTTNNTDNRRRFWFFDLQVANKGLSNQEYIIKTNMGAQVANSVELDEAYLKTTMDSYNWNSPTKIASGDLNIAGVPQSLPNSLSFYLPNNNSRPRLFAVGVFKIS